MSRNPFTSNTYQDYWLKHFAQGKQSYSFDFIKNLQFIKHHYLPYYVNAGKNSTNGITYDLDCGEEDFKGKTCLIYDVPNYQPLNNSAKPNGLKVYKIRQYKGFLANLNGFSNLEDYMVSVMSSKSRTKYRSTLKKFEHCFNTTYKIDYKSITKERCSEALAEFKELLQKRHESLGIDTSIIDKWEFYNDLIYPMINEGKALLISVYADNKPVSMSLAFVEETKLTGAVKAFDPDYYKFNVGHIELAKLIEWCFENNVSILDFSKGEYEYKTKWTNESYLYHCHVLFDSSNVFSQITAYLLAKFFEFKQYLRDKNFNLFVVKLKYKLKNLFRNTSILDTKIEVEPLAKNIDLNLFKLIDLKDSNSVYLKRIIFDLIYRKPEPLSNIKVYTTNQKNSKSFIVLGELNKFKIHIN
ncbi:hypothetical protein DI383_12425 [Flavobacteriaceae bacterium LYZ1037]|nr:hypothetical protein DI383_12425 [Flavobacteriaceae bacterium LYZ1037]